MALKAEYRALSSSPTTSSASTSAGMPPPPSYDSVGTIISDSTPPSSAPCSSSGPSTRRWPASLDTFMYGPPFGDLPLEAAFASDFEFEEHTRAGGRVVEVWDSDMLSDPGALYDFVRAQALKPPVVDLRISGKDPCRDFDFRIDLTPIVAVRDALNMHTCARPRAEPAWRGDLYQRTIRAAPLAGNPGRAPNSHEREVWAAWETYRDARGLPPWSEPGTHDAFWPAFNGETNPSLTTAEDEALLGIHRDAVHDWCEAYCADPGYLKSFEIEKVVWGWDMGALRDTLCKVIREAGYKGDVRVELSYGPGQTTIVRPDNVYVRVRHGQGILAYLLLLLYPLFYLMLMFGERLGGRYRTAVSSYALKFYAPLPNTFDGETAEQARARAPQLRKLGVPPDPLMVPGPYGVHYLVGRREGEWLNKWQDRIVEAVRAGKFGRLSNVGASDAQPRVLDGYEGPPIPSRDPIKRFWDLFAAPHEDWRGSRR